MALVRVPDLDKTIESPSEMKAFLADNGIGFEQWDIQQSLTDDVSPETVLNAYYSEIESLKASGGYVAADCVDVKPDTPGLDEMLNKFNKEHWHDEDEVRFIVEGDGMFHIRPKDGSPVIAVTVTKGDLLRVPAGTLHWFDLLKNRRIRAIRLFQDPSGWTPHYTGSGVEKKYMPVCFGIEFIPPQFKNL